MSKKSRKKPKKRRWWVGGAVLIVSLIAAAPLAWREYEQYRARSALTARDAEAARDHLLRIERTGFADGETAFLLARTFRRLGDFERVRRYLLEARRRGYSTEALQREQWLTLAQSGQLTEAEPHLAELLTDPRGDEREICEAFVNGYCINLQFDAALELLDAWQADFPNDAEPYFRRGYIQQAIVDAAGAVRHYRKGLKLAPHRADARLRLAQALLSLNKLAEAEQEFRRVRRQMPQNAEAIFGLATCLFQRGHQQEAQRLLIDLVEHQPDYYDARELLGELAISENRYDEAIRWLVPLYQEQPNDPGVLLKLVKCYRAQGKTEKVEQLLKSLDRAEQMESRLEELVHKVLERPDDADLRYEIGTLLLEFGSVEDAARWLRSAIETNPRHARAHTALAEYYTQTGDLESAHHHRDLAEQLAQTTSK